MLAAAAPPILPTATFAGVGECEESETTFPYNPEPSPGDMTNRAASAWTFGGNVALNSRLCLPGAEFAFERVTGRDRTGDLGGGVPHPPIKISRTCGSKPMSSIWSASSTTSVRTFDMSRYGSSLAHVSNRPGVATTTSGPCASCSSCGFTDCPPCSVATFNPVLKHRRLACSVTWCASSRVGTRTTHRGRAGVDLPGGFSA